MLCRRSMLCLYRSKTQRVHHRERASAHGEDVTKNAAYSGGRSLERLDIGRMIVRFDLESAGPAVSHVDDAGVFSRSLNHELAVGGQPLQMHLGRLVRAVFAPHHAINAEFGKRWLAA